MSKYKEYNKEVITSDLIEEITQDFESESDEIESNEVYVEAVEKYVAPTLSKIITITEANVRPIPNHKSAKVKSLRINTEMEVIDIIEGSLVQGSNVWYQTKDGYVHFSQVREI